MANKIQFKRGLKANIPTLNIGEPALCTDTGDIYVGGTSSNIQIAKASELANIPLQTYITEKAKQVDLIATNDRVSKNTTDITTKVEKSGVYDDILFAPKSTSQYTPSASKKNVYELLFYLPDTGTMQGLTYYSGYFYVSFDLGSGNGKIVKYDLSGKKISETASMVIGHSAEIAYRESTGKIYVSNGGGTNPTHVYVVNFATSVIDSNLNYESLGTSALLCIDNVHDYLILHTVLSGGDTGSPKFTIINLANNAIINTFTIGTQGTPQGLEADGKHIYLYTNNKVTVLDYEGTIITSYPVNKTGESEGLTMAAEYGTSFLAMGYNTPNRLYALRNFENEKFHNLQIINTVNSEPYGSVALMPRIFTIPIRKNDATTWTLAPWANRVGDSNMVESITWSVTAVTIVLKFAFSSVAYFGLDHSSNFLVNQIEPVLDVATDGKTITVNFFKAGVLVDPATNSTSSNFRILVIGGVSVDV